MPATPPIWPKVWNALRAACKLLMTPALFVGLVVGISVARYTSTLNRENAKVAAQQTANIARVAAFRDTGAALDNAVASFADAAASGEELDTPREKFRQALADHASKVMAIRDIAGPDASNDYFLRMKALQGAVEDTKDARNSGAIRTTLSALVVARNSITDRDQRGG